MPTLLTLTPTPPHPPFSNNKAHDFDADSPPLFSSFSHFKKKVRDYIKGQIEGLLAMLEKERAEAEDGGK